MFERSYGKAYPRSLCDDFFSQVTKAEGKETMKPILYSETHDTYLFYYQKHNLVYIIAARQESPALLFSTFLEHVDRVLCDFYGESKLESRVRSQFVYLYIVCYLVKNFTITLKLICFVTFHFCSVNGRINRWWISEHHRT